MIAERSQFGYVQIIDYATPGIMPVSPKVHLNLMINAKDAMQNGGKLTIETLSEGGNVVINASKIFSLISGGIPIPVSVNFITTKGSRGTGLGLSISRWIIKKHSGEIKV